LEPNRTSPKVPVKSWKKKKKKKTTVTVFENKKYQFPQQCGGRAGGQQLGRQKMQKHGERGRERKKYFQNLGTKVCVILFLKSLLMRASVRPARLL
jgi:hypothetical protein